jgi:hypothetical protein
MGRLYNLIGENLTVGTGAVLASLNTGDHDIDPGGRIKIRRVEITQSGSTTAAMIRAALATRTLDATFTLTAATPTPVTAGGPAATLTGGTNGVTALNCGVASSADTNGTYINKWYASFCNLNGWLWIPTPGEELLIPSGTIFVVKLLAAPTTTTGWNIGVTFEEL